MSILEWAAIGAIGLGMLVICARVMRRGVRTLDEKRRDWSEQMHQTELQIEKDNKNISSAEHLNILRAAIEDLLRLENQNTGYEVHAEGKIIKLQTPEGEWQVELLMRESGLKSSRRVLHGTSRWRLRGFDQEELHADPASLMRSLNGHLHTHPGNEVAREPDHITRRMSHLPQEPGIKRRKRKP